MFYSPFCGGGGWWAAGGCYNLNLTVISITDETTEASRHFLKETQLISNQKSACILYKYLASAEI